MTYVVKLILIALLTLVSLTISCTPSESMAIEPNEDLILIEAEVNDTIIIGTLEVVSVTVSEY